MYIRYTTAKVRLDSLLLDSIGVVAFLFYVVTHRLTHLQLLNIAVAALALITHLVMFGLFQAHLWYGQPSPTMDIGRKHICIYTII